MDQGPTLKISSWRFLTASPRALLDWIKGQLAGTCGGPYRVTMTRTPSIIILTVLSTTLATPSIAQPGNMLSDNFGIMVPEKGAKPKVSEPWLAPKYKSPRGTVQSVRIPKSKTVHPPKVTDPGYVYVPQTGRTFQNLPTTSPGPETFQDRAARCTHQAGVYGQTGTDRSAYMNSCL